MFSCRVCKNSEDNKSYTALDLVVGTKEAFEYVECSQCGSVQIKDIIEDMSKYYSGDYYSFKKRRRRNYFKDNPIKRFFQRKRADSYLGSPSIIGSFMLKQTKEPKHLHMFKNLGINHSTKILDVGCGSAARLLNKLAGDGFTHLEGADPFLEKDITLPNGIKLHKKSISEMPCPSSSESEDSRDSNKNLYDIILLNHTFEHVPNPLEVLIEVSKRLRPTGYAVIGIPMIGAPWEKYKTSWTGVHAPHHIFLHTMKSMDIIINQTDFTIKKVDFVSVGDVYWGSELFKQGYTLSEFKRNKELINKNFSAEQIKEFHKQAAEDNKNQKGDTAIYYLKLKNK